MSKQEIVDFIETRMEELTQMKDDYMHGSIEDKRLAIASSTLKNLLDTAKAITDEQEVEKPANWKQTEGEVFTPTLPAHVEMDNVSDGYHTFKELYDFRMLYNAHLFNAWAAQDKYIVHKSTKHFDGEECFGGGWFIVVALLPTGQITNHYKLDHWDLFKVPALKHAAAPFDGHDASDVIKRLKALIDLENTIMNRVSF